MTSFLVRLSVPVTFLVLIDTAVYFISLDRSSHPEMFCEKCVLRNLQVSILIKLQVWKLPVLLNAKNYWTSNDFPKTFFYSDYTRIIFGLYNDMLKSFLSKSLLWQNIFSGFQPLDLLLIHSSLIDFVIKYVHIIVLFYLSCFVFFNSLYTADLHLEFLKLI